VKSLIFRLPDGKAFQMADRFAAVALRLSEQLLQGSLRHF
jgi:hypothetical protein